MTNTCRKINALLWKDFKIQQRHPIQTSVELLLPTGLYIIFLTTTFLGDTTLEAIKPQELKSPCVLNEIHFCPETEMLKTLMKSVLGNVEQLCNSNITLKAHATRQDMEDALFQKFDAQGLEFGETASTAKDMPSNIDVTIHNGFAYNHKSYFPTNEMIMMGLPYADTMSESLNGFQQLQFALALAIMKDTKLPQIVFHQFPNSKQGNRHLPAVGMLFWFVLMMGYMYTCFVIVRTLATERDLQLKEIMKVMGVDNWIQWTAWYIVTLAVLLLSGLLIMAILIVFPSTKKAVLMASDVSIVFVFFCLVFAAITSFCFLLSVCFASAFAGALMSSLLWILSCIAFLVLYMMQKTSTIFLFLFNMLPGVSFNHGMMLVFKYELIGSGMHWRYLFKKIDREDKFALGYIFIMLIVQIVLYMLLTLYIEAVFPGKYGVAKPWTFLWQSLCRRRKEHESETQSTVSEPDDPSSNEKEPTDLPIGIEAISLRKKYGKNEVVKGVSMRMYEGQITVLLGHNGAGKTTTMSMMTGVIQPTSGTCEIAGNDICRETEQARQVLGLCPQHNVLFPELTVKDHLYFYSKLKGLESQEAKRDITKYLDILGLKDKSKNKVDTLSGGVKRKLSVGIAFIGNSKVVVLDEPTSGMDPSSRRTLWELLQQHREQYTIMLTTHCMDEADALGDRIVIMSHGQVICSGSPFFLKQKFGKGYILIVEKGPKCQTNAVTQLLQGSIPDIVLDSERGTEIFYNMKDRHRSKFEEVLRKLEERQAALDVKGFGISYSTMEEVFLRVGSQVSDTEAEKSDVHSLNTSMNLVGGCTLIMYQIMAMFYKRAVYCYHRLFYTMLCVLLPFLLSSFLLIEGRKSANIKPIDISLKAYNVKTVPVIVNTNNAGVQKIADSYLKHVPGASKIDDDMDTFINKKYDDLGAVDVRNRYIIGAVFSNDQITCYFSGPAIYSHTLSLLMVLNAILKSQGEHSIELKTYPVEQMALMEVGEGSRAEQQSSNVAIFLLMALCLYIMSYVQERTTGAKHLQNVSGVGTFVYWTCSLIWDLLMWLITAITMVIFYSILLRNSTGGPQVTLQQVIVAQFVVMMMFGFAFLPFLYLCSFIFKNPLMAFMLVFIIVFFVGAGTQSMSTLKKNEIYISYFQTLVAGLTKPLSYLSQPVEGGMYNLRNGVGRILLFLLGKGLVLYVLLFIIDFKVYRYICYGFLKSGCRTKLKKVHQVDSDVQHAAEQIHSTDLKTLKQENSVLLINVTKKYRNFVAVRKLNLGIQPGECFGLLGVNGAGKTTTFKMLTGDVKITVGNIYINGHSIKFQDRKVYQCVGYCPQFEALLPQVTVKENLIMYCLIRGIPLSHIPMVIYDLADELKFTQHMKKQLKACSGGTQRKVSTCVATLGNPMVILMDEPTTGMDPESRRMVWNLILSVSTSSCVVLTSHHMEECEALCTRLAIMVNGQFRCLGSTQHLKTKFSKGYILLIKVTADLESIMEFVEKTFQGAELEETHLNLVKYSVLSGKMTLSQMFGVMERAKKDLNIEDYSLGQTSLDQVFLLLAKYQKEAK